MDQKKSENSKIPSKGEWLLQMAKVSEDKAILLQKKLNLQRIAAMLIPP